MHLEIWFIIGFQMVGISLRGLKRISELRVKYPTQKPKEVFKALIQEDWNTLLVSLVVLAGQILTHAAIQVFADWIIVKVEFSNYMLGSFFVAMVLGWAGQDKAFKWLGTADNYLDKKVQEKLS